MIDLSKVTYFLADGRSLQKDQEDNLRRIVSFAQKRVKFHCIKLALVENPNIEGTEWISITPMGIGGYCDFCLNKMADYIESDFVLIFQQDGFIVNPDRWNPEFLNYDYIGAPWGPIKSPSVGNGGFSLRSRKLLKRVKSVSCPQECNEDGVFCSLAPQLEREGFRYAPVDVARRFSIEMKIDGEHLASECFGQHRFHLNRLTRTMPMETFAATIDKANSLVPDVSSGALSLLTHRV